MSTLRVSGVVAGVVVLAFTLYWALAPLEPATPLEGRFANNAVLAIEFARSTADVEAIIGRDLDTEVRRELDTINRLDFVYLAAYGWLLACGFLLREKRRLAALPLVAALADVFENVVLLQLTHTSEVGALLPWLRAFTLIKWELLAVVAALLGMQHWREGAWWRRASGVTGLLALPLGVLTAFDAATFSPLLTLSFVPVWLAVFASLARGERVSRSEG